MRSGRPPLKANEKRMHKITLTFTAYEKARLESLAQRKHTPLATILRDSALSTPSRDAFQEDTVPPALIAALADIAQLLSKLYLKKELEGSGETLRVLSELYTLVERMPACEWK